MSTNEWEPFVGLAFGLLSVAVGIAFVLGRYRTVAHWYFDARSPWYIRHMGFGLIPFGLMMLLWLTAALSAERIPGAAMWSGWLLGAACFVVGIAFMYRPPRALKPAWLRQEESKRSPVRGPERQGGFWRLVDRFAFAFMVLLGVVGMTIFTIMLVIELTTD